MIIQGFRVFDIDARQCFSQYTAVASDEAWLQAQLSLSRGGLGLRSLSSHAAAAYIASLYSSGFNSVPSLHLPSAIGKFNSSIAPSDAVSVESLAQKPPIQKPYLPRLTTSRLTRSSSSLADKARLFRPAYYPFHHPMHCCGCQLYCPKV